MNTKTVNTDDASANVQLQIRMPPSMRQAVKIEAAMREVRVCRWVREAIEEKIARDGADKRAAPGAGQ